MFPAYPIYMNILTLPTIEELHKQLQVPLVNTGRQQFFFSGIVSDDLERLHALTDANGKVRLMSGTEFSFAVYRGQTEQYPACVPPLARIESFPSQLLELCRSIAFEDAVDTLPIVQVSRDIQFLGQPLHINTEGLAQHYGMCTNLLDCTSNFDVASFFATCQFNKHNRQYEPVSFCEKPGIIYQLLPFLLTEETSSGFEIIGWQPLPRPEEQRSFAIRLKHGQKLQDLPTVQSFPFRHKSRISRRIYDAFEQGRSLFPTEPVAEMSILAEKLYQFTRSQVDRAWNRLISWREAPGETAISTQSEQDAGIELVEIPILSWAGMDIEKDDELLRSKLQDVCNRVRYRRACYAT